MTEKYCSTNDNEFIINVQESKIGNCYPRIFIHSIDNDSFVNLDLSLPAIFKMKESDFCDWKADAEHIDEEKFYSLLKGMEINLDAFSDIVKELNKDV